MARLHDQCIKDVLKSLDAYGRTPLYLAVRTSNHTAMKMMLSLGADVDAGSAESGWSPLILACWLQDAVAMEILIGHGANLDHRCNTHCNFTPLTAAAAAQCLPTCRMLLAAGAGGLRALELMSGSAMTVSRRKEIIDFIRSAMAATNLMKHMALCLSKDAGKNDTMFECLAGISWIKESAEEKKFNTRRISQLVCSICGQLL
jgi:ankyrin repeat protein